MRKINKKKVIIIILVIILIITAIIVGILYVSKRDVRDWADIYILRKNLKEEDIETISLNADKSNQIHVYGNYISVLNDKTVNLYNAYGEKVTSFDVNINSGLFDSADKYMAIAENEGNEVCLILDKTYLWGTTTDSEILQVHVNKNGYVAVITTDISHRSNLILYNSEGTKLFTRVFSTTRIIDVSISNDNKFIAIGELDTSGAIIQSNIEIISVQNAKNDPENTIVYTYNSNSGQLITNVEYQENGQIICVYDDAIIAIKDNNITEILKINDDKITYVSNKLNGNTIYVEEQSEGLFNISSNVHIIDTASKQDIIYKLEDIAKQIYTNENIIAINTGTDLYFINTSGWLVKKYTANQEITNVKVSGSLACIVYKDKIEIIDF